MLLRKVGFGIKSKKVPFKKIQKLIQAEKKMVTANQFFVSSDKLLNFFKWLSLGFITKDSTLFTYHYIYCCTKTLHCKTIQMASSKFNTNIFCKNMHLHGILGI